MINQLIKQLIKAIENGLLILITLTTNNETVTLKAETIKMPVKRYI